MIYSPELLLRQFFTVSHLWLLQWSHSCIRFLHIPIPHQLHLSNASFSFISELSMILAKTYRKSIEEAEPSSIAGLVLCELVFSSVLKQLNKNWSEFCFSHVYHLLLPLHFLMAVFNLLNSVEKLICFLKDYFFPLHGVHDSAWRLFSFIPSWYLASLWDHLLTLPVFSIFPQQWCNVPVTSLLDAYSTDTATYFWNNTYLTVHQTI